MILPNRANSGRPVRTGRDHGINYPGGSPRQRLHDIAARIDDGADSSRGRPKNGQTFFGGAEPCLGEMLRRAPAPKPCVVGRIEDEVRAVRLVNHVAREDHFVTDLKADFPPFAAEIDRPWAWSACKVIFAWREPGDADRGHQAAHGQILAVGYQMRLVVTAFHRAAGCKHEHAVVQAADVDAVGRIDHRSAGQQEVVGPQKRTEFSAEVARE